MELGLLPCFAKVGGATGADILGLQQSIIERKGCSRQLSVNTGRQGRTDLPNLRQILQVSETCFGGDPRLFDRRVQRWLHRLRQLSGLAMLGGDSSGANDQVSAAARRLRRRVQRRVGQHGRAGPRFLRPEDDGFLDLEA